MNTQWEYKMLTLKAQSGFFALSKIPADEDGSDILNREGARGWELVNAVSVAPTQALRLFFKRPR